MSTSSKIEQIYVKIASERQKLPDYEFILKLAQYTYAHNATEEQKGVLMASIGEIYFKLAANKWAKVVMEIVAEFPNIKIIYQPNEEKVCDIGNSIGNTNFREQRIIIAMKDSEGNDRKNLPGTIIHEMCHFAVHAAFRNESKPYCADDKQMRTTWEEKIVEECHDKRDMCDLINIAFSSKYEKKFDTSNKFTNELVVRCLQYHVEYQKNEKLLLRFKKIFPKLVKTFEKNVIETLQIELQNIKQIFNLNSENREYVNKFYCNPGESCFSEDFINIEVNDIKQFNTIIKTNQPTLMRFVFLEKFRSEEYFELKYIFITSQVLSDYEKN